MKDEIELMLEATQLIMRDRTWNNKTFEAQSKVTDSSISKLLNPTHYPIIKDKTEDAF